jgi:alcohol dehydrogenase class IV
MDSNEGRPMMQPFTFTPMPRLISGPGTVDRLGDLSAAIGQRVLLVTGSRALLHSGQLDRIMGMFKRVGLASHHVTITGEPSPGAIDDLVRRYRDSGLDVVVAVGGGSVLDAAKAVAAMLKEDGSVGDYLEGVGTRAPSGRSLQVIAVPTTAGTGSEATKNAVISQVGPGGFKKSLRHDNYIPKVVVLDPELCLSAPATITAACGMDALTQLIESYVSTQASPLTDALALDGMRHLIPALPEAYGKGASDVDCRAAVAYGAFLSGVTLANAGLGVVHGVAGPMGGLMHVPHGVACANLLPAAVKATIDNLAAANAHASRATIDKYARIARLFGATQARPGDRCQYMVDALYRWLDDLAVPRLGQFGLTTDHVKILMETASNKNNPVPLSPIQIADMIRDRR